MIKIIVIGHLQNSLRKECSFLYGSTMVTTWAFI